MTSLVLALVLACPPLIRQELEPRRRVCVKAMRPFQDEDWVEHLAICDNRVRRTAKIWKCPIPKEWGDPIRIPPKPKKEDE